MIQSNSYNRCECNKDCDLLDRYEDQPCWGEVTYINITLPEDLDYEPTYVEDHACKGHINCLEYCSGEYIPEKV